MTKRNLVSRGVSQGFVQSEAGAAVPFFWNKLFILGCLLFPHASFTQPLLFHQVMGFFGSADALFRTGYLMEKESSRKRAIGAYDGAVHKQYLIFADLGRAIDAYKGAVRKQHAEAANRLGVLMEGIERGEAIKWHKQAVAWNKGDFSPFSKQENASVKHFGLKLALIPSPGAASALRLGFLFGTGDRKLAVSPYPEKSEEFYNKAYSMGAPAWVIGEMYERHDLQKAIEWFNKETEEESLAMFSVGLALQKAEKKVEEAAQYYKKAAGKWGAEIAGMMDEESPALYEDLVGVYNGARVGREDPSFRQNRLYAIKALIKLGELHYTGQLGDGKHKETARWFYSLANTMDVNRNVFMEVAENHQKFWEGTQQAEDLEWTIKYYRLAMDNGSRGFTQDGYQAKMAELNVILASQNCREPFRPSLGNNN